jgi:Anti-sigma-K factor rskA/Putative zinc-finger
MGTLMDCEQVRELLDAYALGAADPADAAVVEEHVADCVRCWDELSKGQQTAALLALTVHMEEAPARLGERIIARAQRERSPDSKSPGIWSRLRLPWPATAVALGVASLAALVVSAFFGLQVQDLRNKNSDLQTQLASSTSQIQQQLQTTSRQLADQQSIFTVLADDHRVQVPVTNPAGSGAADAYYTWSPAQHKGFLLCEGLPALVAGTMFELWVVTKSGSAQKANPMQSFDSSNGACQVTMDYSALSGTPAGIGITVENAPMSASQHASWLLYGNLATN